LIVPQLFEFSNTANPLNRFYERGSAACDTGWFKFSDMKIKVQSVNLVGTDASDITILIVKLFCIQTVNRRVKVSQIAA